MENDQAARLRKMVRDARRVTRVDGGPPQIVVLAVEPAEAKGSWRFATEFEKAAAGRHITLQPKDQEAPADWHLVIGSEEEEGAEASVWQRASTILLLAAATPSGVLATYSVLKRQHRLGTLPPIHVMFEGASLEEGSRAFESLRATCERFLGWQSIDWGVWGTADAEEGLKGLIDSLLARMPVGGKLTSANPLAEPTAEAV
jgi:hypothetical protein